MSTPGIHLIIGSTGGGKTTYARDLARRERALVFSIDGWMQTLFAADLSGVTDFAQVVARTQRARRQMWEVAEQALAVGVSSVFDSGLLTADDRAGARAMAARLGATTHTHYIAAPADERWRRVMARNDARDGAYMFEITRPMFDFIERVWQEPDAAERATPGFAQIDTHAAG